MSTRGDAYARVVTANPVPAVLDVPDDDLVALRMMVERGRSAMAAPTRQPVTQTTEPRRRRWLEPAAIVAFALVVVLAVIGGATVLLGGSGTSDPVDEPVEVSTTLASTPTEPPTTVTATTVPSEPTATVPIEGPVPNIGAEWTVVAASDEVPVAAVEYVDGIGFVAVGGPFVMVSADGADWQDGDPEGVLYEDAASLTGVTAGGPGVIAWGRTCEGGGDMPWEELPCPQEPVVYLSVDARTWVKAESDAFVGCGDVAGECYAGIGSLASGLDSAIVAAGPDAVTGSGPGGYDVTSVVWASDDGGSTWTRTVVDLASFGPDGAWAAGEHVDGLRHMASHWIGFVPLDTVDATGETVVGQLVQIESSDGIVWERSTGVEPFPGSWPVDLAEGPEGLVAILGDGIWLTTDGRAWGRGTIGPEEELSADMYRLTSLDQGYVIMSMESGSFLFSGDGLKWEVIESELFDSAGLNDIGGHGDVLVAVGYGETDDADSGWVPTVWLWTP